MNVCKNKLKKDIAFQPIAFLGRHFDKVGKTIILMIDFFFSYLGLQMMCITQWGFFYFSVGYSPTPIPIGTNLKFA